MSLNFVKVEFLDHFIQLLNTLKNPKLKPQEAKKKKIYVN